MSGKFYTERAAKMNADKSQDPTVVRYTSGQNKGKFDWLSDWMIVQNDRESFNSHYVELSKWSNAIPPKWVNRPR